MNHNLISEHLEGVKVNGFTIDKKGNMQLTLNLAAKLLILSDDEEVDEEARDLYVSVVAKGKLTVDDKSVKNETFLEVTPKSVVISQIKILDKNGKEIELESTLIQTGFNIKIEEVLEEMKKPVKVNLTTFLP